MGPSGSLASFDSIAGMTCTRGGSNGTIAIIYNAFGDASLRCVIGGGIDDEFEPNDTPLQARFVGALVSGGDQVAGDVDAEHVRSQPRRGQCRRPVAASEVQHLHSRGDVESGDHRLSARSHARRDPGEVTLFPQCLVWIHVMLCPPGRRVVQRDENRDGDLTCRFGAGRENTWPIPPSPICARTW
jgi:hypothetical protein